MQSAIAELSLAVTAEPTDGLRFVARQPILDKRNRLHGYELLFRMGPEASFRGDGDFATRSVIDSAVMFGLEKLTGNLPAFVNCTADAMSKQLAQILPPSITVLEVLEDLEPTPELIESCRELKAVGFRIALDDFVWRPELEPLVKLADYIKVDFVKSGEEERKALIDRLRGTPICLLAEKIETQKEFKQACKEGFTLFQGYYFCRPELLKNRGIPANYLSQIQLLKMMRQETLDLAQLAALVKREPSLTHRLLRVVNSPIYALRQQVDSIELALVVVGEENFRRIATVAITSDLNGGQTAEILRVAFARARFCELAATCCNLVPSEQFLLGLLSMFPAMLRISMEDLVPSLPLRKEISQALMGTPNRERSLLRWVESHERGDWEGCDQVFKCNCFDPKKVQQFYFDAIFWAEAAISTADL
ncbi:MAG: HDOD domain-containing protein [Terracidiphilus sp.]|jgi:EAL and modified HD-GYP domain-containing signal transduction protein